MKFKLSLIFTLTMAVSCTGHDGRSSSREAADSKTDNKADITAVQDFVQDFYNWYAPASASRRSERPADLALHDRPAAFDPALARQLKEDSDAQVKVHDDIVGLDFDPFLCSRSLWTLRSDERRSERAALFGRCAWSWRLREARYGGCHCRGRLRERRVGLRELSLSPVPTRLTC